MTEQAIPAADASGGKRLSGRDWLTYYTECRQYLVAMGQKFTALLGQASVFSFTATLAIVTLAEKLKIGFPGNLLVAVPSFIGLWMYALIIYRYFFQIRSTGDIMAVIESEHLGFSTPSPAEVRAKQAQGVPPTLGLILGLRASRGVFYGSKAGLVLVPLYVTVLALLPLVAAALVAWLPASFFSTTR